MKLVRSSRIQKFAIAIVRAKSLRAKSRSIYVRTDPPKLRKVRPMFKTKGVESCQFSVLDTPAPVLDILKSPGLPFLS